MDILFLPAAFGLGAVHALEPGHGKTLVTTYLVGNRGRKRDAWLLGGIVALSHTASVLLLAVLGTWILSSVLDTQGELFRWIEVFSGGLILTVGVLMLYRTALMMMGSKGKSSLASITDSTTEGCTAGHAHSCSHQKLVSDSGSEKETESSLMDILMLGLASGLCPSPLPLVMLTSAMVAGELHDLSAVVGYLLTFSLGLAFVVVILGLALIGLRQSSFQWAQNRFSGFSSSVNMPQLVRVFSSVLIMGLGGYLVFQALWGASEDHVHHLSTLHHLLPVH